MSKKTKSNWSRWRNIAIIVAVLCVLIVGGALLLDGKTIDVLDPQGVVADQQKTLIIFTVVLGLAVIIPVFILLFVFASKYREGNDAIYTPDHASSHKLEAIWWGIPVVIIIVLSIVTWVTSHQLDPYKKLETSDQKEIVQVVSLQWRWLFIYPEHGIATVSDLRFPAQTDMAFRVTSDGPMSTFWIPQLGSQIYAMNGMTSQLHLQSHKPGSYRGMNTNITGEGYAGMDFYASVTSQNEFTDWIKETKRTGKMLDWAAYEKLSQPSEDKAARYYTLSDRQIYDKIIQKYMPHHESADSKTKSQHSNGGTH